MSEQERAHFLNGIVSRPPGKRQIKPSSTIFEENFVGSDEDDEDFTAILESDDSELEYDSDADLNDSDENDENKSDCSSTNEESVVAINEDQENTILSNDHLERKNSLQNNASTSLICTICLNLRKATIGAEIIQSVHESCYAVDDLSDNQSVSSSSSTEPWFCEPCLFGMNTIPYCELCPNRYGAFKKAGKKFMFKKKFFF